uniref:RNA ligase domain-containing protein n=1 Tax=OCS116 cluster bacterium TaxID=2030921 RepID=A0A2A4Z4Z0_9PROT
MKKYGRTFHLPISLGTTSDDKIQQDSSILENAAEVIFTEKMDGENTTIHHKGCHARSPDSGYHASRDWIKAFAAGISPQLIENERIVGEYLFARHSIAYTKLPSYFMGFAWVLNDIFQSWDETIERFQQLGINSVPVLYRGQFNKKNLDDVCKNLQLENQEGFVVRTATAFAENEMATHMAKYVRQGHVQSEKHWMHSEIIRNGLE